MVGFQQEKDVCLFEDIYLILKKIKLQKKTVIENTTYVGSLKKK